jgi:hypothetical protein
VTDIYAKLGDYGSYSSLLVLLPDCNAGFGILAASSLVNRVDVVSVIAELIADSVLPALQAQAASEAEDNFGGIYTSTAGLNSSLTLIYNQTENSPPGLVVLSWISNGTDMITRLPIGFGPAPWRILPSISDPKNGKAAFRLASAVDAPSPQALTRLFSAPGIDGQDWLTVDALTYGDIGVGSFVFAVGKDRKAMAVSLPAFQITLKREG